MQVLFSGVGEAVDERFPNVSILVRTDAGGRQVSALLDCGFNAAQEYWRYAGGPEELDALWISHFHGDHFMGTPALLLRFWEMKRRKPLVVIGQPGVSDIIPRAMELAYPGFMEKLGYPLEFEEVEPGRSVNVAGLTWRFAENSHGRRDLAVRVEDGIRSVFYSGDGGPTARTLELARGSDAVIHESFGIEQLVPGHGSISGCIDFARQALVPCLALVHVQRDVRRDRHGEIMKIIEDTKDLRVILPEPGYLLNL